MHRLLPLGLTLALAACSTRPPPGPEAVDPARGSLGLPVEVVISGRDFRPFAVVDLDRPSQSVVNRDFSLVLSGVPLEQVEYLDSATLRARVPGTLGLGVHALTVTDPAGRSATLEGAFTVVAGPVDPAAVRIETAPGGAGAEVGDLQVRVGRGVTLFAVARRPDGSFQRDVDTAEWTLAGVGTLTATTGRTIGWVATVAGSAQVQVSAPDLGVDVTGTLTASPCTQAADCADACSSQVSCVLGACVSGASTRDADGDGFVDATCPGGTDCDDGRFAVKPGAPEGPEGDATCADTLDNDCDGKVDALAPRCLPNAAPIARLVLTPQVAVAGSTFTGSGATSSDREDPGSALVYDWDWDGDGAFEAQGVTSSHVFTAPGQFQVVLRVTDTGGATGYSTAVALLTSVAADIATVTTGVDEANAGATPANPQGAGFSLREAVAWATAAPGQQTIVVPAGTTIALTSQLDLADNQGLHLVGNGAAVDGTGIAGVASSCLDISGRFNRVDGLEIKNCKGWPIYAHGQDTVVTRCRIHDNGYGVEWEGANDTFGPDNEVWTCGNFGIDLNNLGAVVGNRIHGIGAGVGQGAGPGVNLRGSADNSTVVGNTVYGSERGIYVAPQCDGLRLWNNTLHGNALGGLWLSNAASGADVRNNLVTNNGGWGLDAAAGSFGAIDANDLFDNASGGCRACSTLGPRALAVAPGYVDAAAFDLRLFKSSPLVNAGVDTGADRNGPAPGTFNGAAPDVGAYETP